MGLFTDLFSTQPAQDAANAKIAGLNNQATQYGVANTSANDALTAGQTGADALYGQASAPFTSLMESTGRGSAAYGDATGANGADGLARARALYQADPGYNGGLTTGIDQVNRTAAQRGDLGGGNTSADEIKFASDYDNRKYHDYVSSLAPYLGANQSAISGNAGLKTGQAGLDLGVAGQRASNNWNANIGIGTDKANIGNANADAALAPYAASSNFWNALMGGAKLAVSAATGMPTGGGGGGFSSGGGFFGGGTPDYGQSANVNYGGTTMPMFGRAG